LNPAGEKLRQVLKELDASKDAGQSAELGSQARELIRVHIAESQDVVRDLQERLRMSQEESDLQAKKKVEMEKMLARRDAAYEELLGGWGLRTLVALADFGRKIHIEPNRRCCGHQGELQSVSLYEESAHTPLGPVRSPIQRTGRAAAC
jgi:kinesin family protein 5